MKKYKHSKEKKPTDRVGFYIALSVCMMAVGFAVWSVYTNLESEPLQDDSSYFSTLVSPTAAVAQDMTGVTEAETAPATEAETQAETMPPTEAERGFTISETKPPHDGSEIKSTLQAGLKVDDSLVYPVKSGSVVKEFSEDAVYNETMKDYRAHSGCDFAAGEGESVYAMCEGTVTDISVSELYGTIIEIDCGDFYVYYCGLSTDTAVSNDNIVSAGDTIGTVGQIPCESDAPSHIHIEVRVGDKLIDPLSVINSDR